MLAKKSLQTYTARHELVPRSRTGAHGPSSAARRTGECRHRCRRSSPAPSRPPDAPGCQLDQASCRARRTFAPLIVRCRNLPNVLSTPRRCKASLIHCASSCATSSTCTARRRRRSWRPASASRAEQRAITSVNSRSTASSRRILVAVRVVSGGGAEFRCASPSRRKRSIESPAARDATMLVLNEFLRGKLARIQAWRDHYDRWPREWLDASVESSGHLRVTAEELGQVERRDRRGDHGVGRTHS